MIAINTEIPKNLEKSQNETIVEFKKRLTENPELNHLDSFCFDKGVDPICPEAKNVFDVELYLVQELKKAYEAEDVDALNKVSGWTPKDKNTLTFYFSTYKISQT